MKFSIVFFAFFIVSSFGVDQFLGDKKSSLIKADSKVLLEEQDLVLTVDSVSASRQYFFLSNCHAYKPNRLALIELEAVEELEYYEDITVWPLLMLFVIAGGIFCYRIYKSF